MKRDGKIKMSGQKFLHTPFLKTRTKEYALQELVEQIKRIIQRNARTSRSEADVAVYPNEKKQGEDFRNAGYEKHH